MNFDSTVTHESEALPGVKFTVKRLNNIERAKRDLAIAEHSIRFADLLSQIRELQGETDKGGKPLSDPSPDDKRSIARLDHEAGLVLNAYLKPAVLRGALVSVEGLDIGGSPATADTVLASAPDALIDEIWIQARTAEGMTGDQAKNSSSPSDSGAPVDGPTAPTNVERVAA